MEGFHSHFNVTRGIRYEHVTLQFTEISNLTVLHPGSICFTSKTTLVSLQNPCFTSKPMLHFNAHASLQSRMLLVKAHVPLQSPCFTSKPMLHFKAACFIQSRMLHFKAACFIQSPMLHFKAPCFHFKAACFTSKPHASLQRPMLHFKAACFTSMPHASLQSPRFTSMPHASYSMFPTHTTFCLVRSYSWLHRLLEQQVTHNYYPANQKRYRNNSNRTGDATTVTTKVTQTPVTRRVTRSSYTH